MHDSTLIILIVIKLAKQHGDGVWRQYYFGEKESWGLAGSDDDWSVVLASWKAEAGETASSGPSWPSWVTE